MIGLDRQGWILVGFGVLFFTALAVSVCGWLLLWRSRRAHAAGSPLDRAPREPDAPEDGTLVAAEAPPLPPANPLR